ncbi:NUDIX domain-containing protein [Chamaesiphon sp. VAR_48_metabat_403]|uniref:NUDIX hydrolase n=1 Tax=Chamaesiphon sp. VAR_48_metabat_403 TaxID=2964700 RepID=UPI00286D8EC8|nr:NUDIX domain-containing protein [Chamaesiphon sp. VAR_48_metabat_403]
MKQTFTIGAFAIITDAENRILWCLRTDLDLWNLPGGTVENGEAPWDCVIREVKEETGLDIVVEKLIGIYSKPEENDLVFSYKCRVVAGNLQNNEEAKEIEYFDFNKLPRNIVHKQVVRVKDYFDNNDRVVMVKQ